MMGADLIVEERQHELGRNHEGDPSYPHFVVYQSGFRKIIGQQPTLVVSYQSNHAFAHEAGIFLPHLDAVFITSNQLQGRDGSKQIKVTRMQRHPDGTWEPHDVPANVHMANGGINFANGMLFCDQGSLSERGGIVQVNAEPSYASKRLIDNFGGRRFNSPNDVVVRRDGSIWFTDPAYGYEQGICPPPQLPNQVYRYDPATSELRAIADGFAKPNGLAFSPDETVLYVTDTGRVRGDGTILGSSPASIYAFDVSTINGSQFLVNRRLFAMADVGVPDGIKCDSDGNVYSGCGDGLSVWSSGGSLLGKIIIPGGIANFCFGRSGELFLLNEDKFWLANLSKTTRGVLLHNLNIDCDAGIARYSAKAAKV